MDKRSFQAALAITALAFNANIALSYNAGSDICNKTYDPSECGLPTINLQTLRTVEDFDRCAPSLLPKRITDYFLAASGRRITYTSNMDAFRKYRIMPRALRDVSEASLTTTVLGHRILAPIGLSPVAAMKLAHPEGELGAARATATEGVVMILSSSASATLEEVAAAAASACSSASTFDAKSRYPRLHPVLWMQTYIYKNREETLQLIRRAERVGFKAIVVTVDSPIVGSSPCKEKKLLATLTVPNFINKKAIDTNDFDASLTFQDLAWVVRNTKLPVVAKGILNGEDAVNAALTGISGILVSNHGGRQLDGSPATIDVLPEIVRALKVCCPAVEVYLDSGVRNGFDVYKALARGARAVFVGRPTLWGLAAGGGDGVRKVLSILKSELNNTMILAGFSQPSDISPNSVVLTGQSTDES